MKAFYVLAFSLLGAATARAQITLTAADVPVSGDTLRFSRALPLGTGINTSITGANQTWNFSTLTPVAQSIDTYRTAAQVNPIYAFTISPTAYGYKVADSLPGFNPSSSIVQIRDVYAFFNKKNSPSRYVAEGGALTVNGLPTAANYSDEDEWFFFPLQYLDVDSSTYSLSFTIPLLGTYKQSGTRKTTVDGWGTIVTPYTGTMPRAVLRLRSVVEGVDSVIAQGTAFGIPRRTVEYKWMALGERYPLLWVTANNNTAVEVITDVRYRDVKRNIPTSVAGAQRPVQVLALHPNPATAVLHLDVPAGWQHFSLRIFNAAGALVTAAQDTRTFDVAALPAGHYFVLLDNGTTTAVGKFQK